MSELTTLQLNQLRLHAVLQELGVVRYTPSGLAIIEIVLSHQSQQSIPNFDNQHIEFEIGALIVGDSVEPAQKLRLGQAYEWQGFLYPPRKSAKRFSFRILDWFEI